MRAWKYCLVLGLVALAACSTASSTIEADQHGVDDAEARVDVRGDQAAPLDIVEVTPAPDVEVPDFQVPDQQDPPDGLGPQCDPGEGCFLDPCSDNADCQSGWCVQHLGEEVCSQLCQEECPPGWACNQVAGTDPDVVYICVSNFANLCRPCATSADCTSTGGAEDTCLDYGPDGNFCGGPCGDDGECPWGFSCSDALTVDGVAVQQCTADAGSCPCTDHSTALALSTPCEVSNEHGVCDGKRVCAAGGLSPCDAAVPEAESCNGVDDDCDGEVDEPDLVDGAYQLLCDDGNDCTEDSCSGAEGCVNSVLDSGACNDANPCTVADHCEAGVCVGQAVNCDDQNPCTDDWCTEDGGCEHEANEAKCDDGDPCTVADLCEAGTCAGTSVNCECQVDDDCGALEDGDLCNGTLVCDASSLPYQCVVDPDTVVTCEEPGAFCLKAQCDPATGTCSDVAFSDGLLCEDGDLCTAGATCLNGLCQGGQAINCNDGDVCTDDSCQSQSGCLHEANQKACSDGDACTAGDVCAAGVCQPGQDISCDDKNPCTDDSCDASAGCLHTHNAAACSDGNACTEDDLCSDGVCQPGGALVCNDENLCTDDACDPKTGCTFKLNTVPCDDGDSCTVGDVCQLGECQAGPLLKCDDNNPCTQDGCSNGAGCQFVPLDIDCDDGNACTTGDHCVNGTCVAGGNAQCDDNNACTLDTCDAGSGCLHEAVDAACSDGDACTVGDACVNGACVPGPAMSCDDGNVCTDDSCDAAVGCQHVDNAAECSDGNACTSGDVCSEGTCQAGTPVECDDENICTDDSCDPELGCQYSANAATCDDGNACTVTDQCQNKQCFGTGAPDCNDDNVCTEDTCDPESGCVNAVVTPCCSNGEVEAGEECDDGNLTPGDGCDATCHEEVGICSNGSAVDCNPPGTTLNPDSRFVDPNPPDGWTQCAGFINTSGDDVSNTFLNNCLNTNRLRVKAWRVDNGQLEEDVYSANMSVGGSWPNWNYLGGSITKVKFTYWTGGTTYFSATNGQDACEFNCCNAAPSGTLTLGTGNGSSAIVAPGNTNSLEWRVNCGGTALGGRRIAFYR